MKVLSAYYLESINKLVTPRFIKIDVSLQSNIKKRSSNFLG